MSASTWGLLGALVIMSVLGPAMARAYRRSTRLDARRRVIIRYTHWYLAFAIVGLLITLSAFSMGYVLRSSMAGVVMCSMMALVFGGITYDFLRKATTRLMVTDEGLAQRNFGKGTNIRWSDASVDAVERVDGAVVIRGNDGQEVVVSEHMVGAKALESFVARNVPRERVRVAASPLGKPAHFFRPYERSSE